MPTTEELALAGEDAEGWKLTVEHETEVEGSLAGVKVTFPDMGVDDIQVIVRIATYGYVEVWVEGNCSTDFHTDV